MGLPVIKWRHTKISKRAVFLTSREVFLFPSRKDSRGQYDIEMMRYLEMRIMYNAKKII